MITKKILISISFILFQPSLPEMLPIQQEDFLL